MVFCKGNYGWLGRKGEEREIEAGNFKRVVNNDDLAFGRRVCQYV